MNALLGWCAGTTDEGAATAILGRMARGVATPDAVPPQMRLGPAAAVAIAGAETAAGVAADDGLLAAIAGRPRWTEDELAALAARAGQGAALLAAYRRHGTDLLQHLRGAFTLAVVAPAARKALLAVDRLGIGTLCYSLPEAGGLIFGTTADIVRAHPRVASTVTPQAVFDYLYFGISPSPGTIYREQSKLLPAQFLTYEGGAVRTGFYWRMPYREAGTAPVAALSAELMERLRQAVGRVVADVDPARLGAFLSGGLDSSTVAGLLSEASGGQAKTFTIGFAQDRYDEARYAEITARHFGTAQHTYVLTPQDVAEVVVKIARAFDEPFGNSSVVPTYYCAKLARERGVGLMLAGDGGDEIFAGNARYVDQAVFGLYDRIPAALRRLIIEPVLGLPGARRAGLLRRAGNYVDRARIPLPDRLESYNFYRTVDLATVFEADALAAIDREAPLRGLRETYGRTLSSNALQRMMHLDLKITLADNDLRKVGVGCAMAGMPVAYPFLDDEVVEFSARVPPALQIRRLERRWFFRQAVKDFLAPETLAKRKHGFGMPYAEWPREDPRLREIAADCLAGFKRRRYLRGDFLDGLFAPGEPSRGVLIWDIMMLELWFRAREAEAGEWHRDRSVA